MLNGCHTMGARLAACVGYQRIISFPRAAVDEMQPARLPQSQP